MATKTISTFNGATNTPGAAAYLTISVNSLPVIQSIKGYCNGTANAQYFLQLHNTQGAPPADTAVPIWCQQILGGDGFIFDDRPTGTNSALLSYAAVTKAAALAPASGLILCLSTTEATLTIGTGNVTMDVAVEIDCGDIPFQNETRVVGTTVASLAVAADPSTKKLTRFVVDNNGLADAYLMLFGYTAPATGAVPVAQWKVTANQQAFTQSFGRGMFVEQGKSTNYTIHTGIYLYGSTTSQTFTADGNNWDIVAFVTTL